MGLRPSNQGNNKCSWITYLTAHKEPAPLRRRAAVGWLELKRTDSRLKVTRWRVQSVALFSRAVEISSMECVGEEQDTNDVLVRVS